MIFPSLEETKNGPSEESPLRIRVASWVQLQEPEGNAVKVYREPSGPTHPE